MKANAYSSRDRIRDLYDITYIINNKFEELNPYVKSLIRSALEYKGLEQFDYITRQERDDLIDNDELESEFLEAFDRLGLIAKTSKPRVYHKAPVAVDWQGMIDKAAETCKTPENEGPSEEEALE